MDYARLTYLFEQYEKDTASEAELDELFAMLDSEADREALLAYFEKSMREAVPEVLADFEKWRPVIAKIVAAQSETPALRRKNRWWRYAAAAAITLLVGVGVYYVAFYRKETATIVENTIPPAGDVPAPATTKAFVTLADGSRIVLDSVANGALATQGNAQLVKLADGRIAYQGTGGEVVYNTLTNPRGSKVVNLVLADGSTVWLNAASSITYPASFTGNAREVHITGEAYFEVAAASGLLPGGKKGKLPFIVRKGHMQVQVLGTRFNVNAYDNENNIKVTLLEGSVQVSSTQAGKPETLRPGEEAAIYPNGTLKVVGNVDTARTMAWKNGYFDFNNADLPVMMRQLERWYDISVTYQGEMPRIIFKGQMDRNVQLTDVIRFLNIFNIKASLQGRTLTITGS